MAQVTLNGSSLCDTVPYEAGGDLQRFYHCHCARCRKRGSFGIRVRPGLARVMSCRGLRRVRCDRI